LLIVTNATTRDFWANEINNLLSNAIEPHEVCVVHKTNEPLNHAKIVIMSYAGLGGNFDELMKMNFGVVIFDESHNLKNSKAKQTVNAKKISASAHRIICITGTPALSRPAEIYPQLEIISKKFPKFREFGDRYCDGKVKKNMQNT
jgi:SWI/SNF-related matrix-associated actin-dependent regulator 1 of chromatin subfamily A